jgi:hypothetical protein
MLGYPGFNWVSLFDNLPIFQHMSVAPVSDYHPFSSLAYLPTVSPGILRSLVLEPSHVIHLMYIYYDPNKQIASTFLSF